MILSSPKRLVAGAIVIGGDFQGLSIVRSLAAHRIPAVVIDHELNISRFSRYPKKILQTAPPSEDEQFAADLAQIIRFHRLYGWVVYPTSDEAVRALAKHKQKLEETVKVPTPEWKRTKTYYDKRLTYKLAGELSIPIPRTWYPKKEKDLPKGDVFPLIVKPAIKDRFYGAVKAKALPANDEAELIAAYRRAREVVKPSEIMVQELIPGSSDCQFSYCALFKEKIARAQLAARRTRQHPMDFGHASTFVETIEEPILAERGQRLLAAGDYYGLAEVEFKRDPRDGEFKLLEVNPRTWGWHGIGARAGVDFPYLLYLDAVGKGFAANGYKSGVKWMRLATDLPTAVKEMAAGRMGFAEYAASWRGDVAEAVFSLKDPLPFFAEFALALELFRKRGF